MENNDNVKKIREFFATTSTDMLKKYYKDLLLDVIPKDLKDLINNVDIKTVIEIIEQELSVRGEFKRSKKISIQ